MARSLQQMCAEWQRILRLQDWDIEARWGDTEDLRDDYGYGRVHRQEKVATVWVLDSRRDARHTRYDAEQVLVHELLHIKTRIACGEEDLDGEAIIDQLAWALVRLRRGEV